MKQKLQPLETLVVHYDKLIAFLNLQTKQDPERTYSHLDLLRENIQKNATEILNGDMVVVDIDHNDKAVSVFGTPLKWDYNILMPELVKSSEEKIYKLFYEARDVTRRHFNDQYSTIFEDFEEFKAKKKQSL